MIDRQADLLHEQAGVAYDGVIDSPFFSSRIDMRNTMSRSILLLAPAALLLLANWAAAADPAPNTLTDDEKTAGWKLLFDGKTTAGWRNYKKTNVGPGWKVRLTELRLP